METETSKWRRISLIIIAIALIVNIITLITDLTIPSIIQTVITGISYGALLYLISNSLITWLKGKGIIGNKNKNKN